MSLKSRRSFPPAGWIFYEPKTNWTAPMGLSFDQVVAAIIQHREANPRFAKEWMTSPEDVSNELDFYTCTRLNHDPNYCDSGGSPPNFQMGLSALSRRRPTPSSRAQLAGKDSHFTKTVAGIGLAIDWLGSGLSPVPQELAERRAITCSRCSKNQDGDFWQRIAAVTANNIKKVMAIRTDMKLSTTLDDKLHSCTACDCFLKLKVHTPLSHIIEHTSENVMKDLDENCWIRRGDK